MALSKPIFTKFCTCLNQLHLSKRLFVSFVPKNKYNAAFQSQFLWKPINGPVLHRLFAAESKGPRSSIRLAPIITKDRLILLGFGGMALSFCFLTSMHPIFTFASKVYGLHNLTGMRI